MEIKLIVNLGTDANIQGNGALLSRLICLNNILVKEPISESTLEKALFFAHESLRPGYHLGPVDSEGFSEVIRSEQLKTATIDYIKMPSPLFWKRLKSFVGNVQVGDAMSEEEKQMIILACDKQIEP